MKIAIIFIKTTFQDSKKVQRIRKYESKSNFISIISRS